MIELREEAPGDVPAREVLLDRSFGRGRFRKTCEKLRRGRLPAEGLAFTAVFASSERVASLTPSLSPKGEGVVGARTSHSLSPWGEGQGEGVPRDGTLVGTVRLWNIEVGSAGSALMLGPIAVAPELRGQGLGQALMRHALGEAKRLGHRAVILVGDAPYYARFGFDTETVQSLALPGPVDRARFLGLELVAGALDGATGLIAATGRLQPARKTARAA